jgi:Helicase HerA-like C-terminal
MAAYDPYWLFELFVAGAGLCAAIWLIRWAIQRQTDRQRSTYELFFPGNANKDKAAAFLRSTHILPKLRRMFPAYAISLEHYAEHGVERYFLHIAGNVRVALDELFLEHVDGTIEPVDDDPVSTTNWTKGAELGISRPAWSELFRVMSVEDTAATFRTVFRNLGEGERMVQQIQVVPTSEERDKDHAFYLIVRLGVVSDKPDSLMRRAASPYHTIEKGAARFTKRVMFDVAGRIRRRATTFHFGMMLSVTELLAILGWPLDGTGMRKARRIEPTLEHDWPGEKNITIGTSNSPRTEKREVAVSIEGLMRHFWGCGPTGTGKTTLLQNLGYEIMDKGMGLISFDIKGDLNRSLLECAPRSRVNDIINFNVTDSGRPIGLNILSGDNPSRITGHLISMFKILSGDAWGHQMQRVLRIAIYTAAVYNNEAQGEELTLYDVKQLLVNREYRGEIVRRINRGLHPDLVQEWRWIDEKHDLVLDAAVTRVDAFLADPVVRNIVSQRGGLDVDWVAEDSKILLFSAPGALIGEENAAAITQLAWEYVWDAHQRRKSRTPNILMADEFQMYAGQSLSKADPFALARSYGLGLIVANQYASQLPKAIYETVSRNAQNIVSFAVSPEDARNMKDHFGPLTADDLMYLPQYTVAARVMGSGGRAPTVTLKTPAPRPSTGVANYIVDRSRHLYGRPVEEVQADLLRRHQAPEPRKRPKIGEMDT